MSLSRFFSSRNLAAHSRRCLATVATRQKGLFDKILIANRGEIACRVMKTCRKMGIKTVAIYSDADHNALHVQMADEAVRVGPAVSKDSYLNVDNIVEACLITKAQAVHPGYGFLSEKKYFANALEKNGVKFIGPSVSAIESMGDKIASKTIARNAKVSTIPGYLGLVKDEQDVIKIANEIGYPVMIKASAGGGGKGMRVAWNDEDAKIGYRLSKAEAMSSFNSDTIFVEKFIQEPRHIEVQVMGDDHGNYVYFNERECSIQRRNQKVIEEAPSVFLNPETRKQMGEQACALARAVKYASAGTVEMLVDKHRKFYFLEMNTRLQVEHPITEMITGFDLVEQMIRVAAGLPLSVTQKDIGINGWALETRVYAEDPLRGFLPSIGRLTRYVEPKSQSRDGDVRVDTGIREGSDISIHYDPMISKLVTHGKDRNEALQKMRVALDSYVIRGVTHNVNFLRSITDHPRFIEGRLSTNFIPDEYPEGYKGHVLSDVDRHNLIASAFVVHSRFVENRGTISGKLESYEPTQHYCDNIKTTIVGLGDEQYRVEVVKETEEKGNLIFELQLQRIEDKKKASNKNDEKPATPSSHPVMKISVSSQFQRGDIVFSTTVNEKSSTLQVIRASDSFPSYLLQYLGTNFEVSILTPQEHEYSKLMPAKKVIDTSKFIVSPMPGAVYSVNVKVGDQVVPGQEVCVVEAMKMQNALRAQRAGKIKAVKVVKGKTVAADEVLIEFE